MRDADSSMLSYEDCLRIFRAARREADSVGGGALERRALEREQPDRALTPAELLLCAQLGLVRQLRRIGGIWEYDITELGRVLVEHQDRAMVSSVMDRMGEGRA